VVALKIHGVQYTSKSPFYVNFKKHFCPVCHDRLGKTKVSRIVNSKSEEAKDYDFSDLSGNIKFTWTEFKCPGCGRQYRIEEMKKIEKALKKSRDE
jgi:predicted RNA-binding Zn-ribbon protein involved in translation (DUF1610 family)